MNGYNYLNRPGGVCNEVCFYDLTSKDIYLVNLNLTCEKKDENGYYLAINGKKYPLPNKKDWKTLLNDYQLSSYLFRDCMLNYDSFPCFTGGGVGYFFERNVSVYSCDGCGYQYHLVSMSSFIHRDKSKDGIVEEIEEEIKEETGYKDIESIEPVDCVNISRFFVEHKGENRKAIYYPYLVTLHSKNKGTIDEAELAEHECVWVPEEELDSTDIFDNHRQMIQASKKQV